MKLNITEEERAYLLQIVSPEQQQLRKKLLNTRKRKSTTYSKCTKEQQENLKKIEEIVRNNYKIKNETLIARLGIAKSTFYRVYAEKTKELKREYKSQSLF